MPEPVLRKSPLTNVVCEVRFEASAVGQGQILKLAKALEPAGLMEYAMEEGFQVAVRPGQIEQRPVHRHRFAAPDGSSSVTLDLNAFAFETAAYGGVDPFLEAWRPVAQAVGEALGLEARTRIGLRYVNEIALGGGDHEAVQHAVNPDLLPPWGGHAHLETLANSLHELRFTQEEGELAFRHGLQRPAGAGRRCTCWTTTTTSSACGPSTLTMTPTACGASTRLSPTCSAGPSPRSSTRPSTRRSVLMPDVLVGPPAQERSAAMQETGVRRAAWEGAGNHGFVRMDSLADTGDTLVPRRARTAGATGAFGDPLFEALIDEGQGFTIFAVALGQNAMPRVEDDYAWDVVTITPQRERLRRPEIRVVEAAPQVALEPAPRSPPG